MSVKDWPRPGKLAFAWLLLSASTAILLATTYVLLIPILSGRGFEHPDAPWSNVLAHYTTLITAPIAAVCAVATSRYLWRKRDRKFVMFFVMGVAVGIGVGLVLTPITGGFSLISAPPFATSAMLFAWLFLKLFATKGSNPATPAP